MTITAEEERGFYDDFYSKHLSFPDDALLCDRPHMRADLDNPANPIYERRRLYATVLELLLSQPLQDRAVLDYGCGIGPWGVLLATEGARVTLLDLSPVGIQVGLRRARINGVAQRVRGVARDASDLSCFADNEFDLIYASAAIHHTLKYPNALRELVRVLKPGGRLVVAETYGNNRLLNLARRLRWRLSREPAEAGEEILLSDREIALLRPHFRHLQVRPLNLLAMAKRLFRGRFTNPLVRGLMWALEVTDAALLKLAPPLRRYCGEVIVLAEK